MKYEVFCIKDHAIQAFLRPFYAVAIGQATRIFTDEVNNAQGDMFKHANDYDLYHVGTWNDHDAAHTHHNEGPRLILRGKDAQRASE